jgi:hypothetical protein
MKGNLMRLTRFKRKYILRTEFDADGTWTPVTVDEVFGRNPQITDAHAAFAKYAVVDEWNQYGPTEIRGRTYRLAVYKKRGSRMRLIQTEQIPPTRPVDLTNVEWPKP